MQSGGLNPSGHQSRKRCGINLTKGVAGFGVGLGSGRCVVQIHHSRAVIGYFRPVQRQCSRSGCAESAVVTLTYQYARSAVWLDDLSAERDPHAYDLCQRHGARLSVPHGWRMEDRRSHSDLALAAAG